MDIETVSMTIIAYSGDCRTFAFKALEECKKGNIEESKKLMKLSEENSKKAHEKQSELLVYEANGGHPEINVLLIHSQDHLVTSMLAQELIKEIIHLHEIKKDK